MLKAGRWLILVWGIIVVVIGAGCAGRGGALPTLAPVAAVPTETATPLATRVLPTPLPSNTPFPSPTPFATVPVTATAIVSNTLPATEELPVNPTHTPFTLPPTIGVPPTQVIPTNPPVSTRPPLPTNTPIPPRPTKTPIPSITPTPSNTPTVTPTPQGWKAEFFNGRDLSGTPVLVRYDADVNFDWGSNAPASGVSADQFAVRWNKTVNFSAGSYRFNVIADDGVRIWLNGEIILDEWHDTGNRTYSTERTLVSGAYNIRIEFYEGIGTAKIQFWYENRTDFAQWRGEYFTNKDLSGSPQLVRNDAEINFNWGAGSPIADIPVDGFSVRWTLTYAFAGGNYSFYTRSDDGVRVYLDNVLIVNEWHDAGNRTYSSQQAITAGNHTVRVEYYENAGTAQILFGWNSTDYWVGSYFNNKDLNGTPTLSRNDTNLDFDWGSNAPDSSLPADNFSVRWNRSYPFQSGVYRFHVLVNDGARLYVDGNLIISDWRDAPARELIMEYTVVNAGTYPVKVEFYEGVGTARIKVWWELISENSTWSGEYYTNKQLSGTPAVTRADTNLDFDWGTGSPMSQLPTDNFSVRWTRSVSFQSGTYRFHILVNDGARLYIDGTLAINDWRDGAVREVTVDKVLSAGTHPLKVEFYEGLGTARIKVWWEKLN